MTRSEVARYLGKSIATVRRAEGTLLHPRRDANGVHHFRLEDVERLRAAINRDGVRLSPIDFDPHLISLQSKHDPTIAELKADLAELHSVTRIAIDLVFRFCPGRVIRQLDEEILTAFGLALDGRS